MAKSKLRFGIIGAGTPNQSIGGKELYHGVGEYHASAITEFAELVAIASRSESSARGLADKSEVKDIYTDYRELLERKDIDAVTIGTPSGTHGDIAIDATQDDITEATWTETVTNLGWAAHDIVLCRLSRPSASADNLSGDLNVLGFAVEVPRA